MERCSEDFTNRFNLSLIVGLFADVNDSSEADVEHGTSLSLYKAYSVTT